MLNALWLNSQELNGNGVLQQVVSLGASATAGATAAAPAITVAIGLAANTTAYPAGATAIVTVSTVYAIGASVEADALGDVLGVPIAIAYGLAASVIAGSSGLLGLSLPRSLAASVSAGATGLMYPYAALCAASVSAGATAATPGLVTDQSLAGSGSAGATSATVTGAFVYVCATAVSAGATGIAAPDVKVGGIWQVGLGGSPTAGASAVVTIDPSEPLPVSVSTATSAIGQLSATVSLGSAVVCGADAVLTVATIVTIPSASASAGATAVGQPYLIAGLVGGSGSAGALTSPLILGAARPFTATVSAGASIDAPALSIVIGLGADTVATAAQTPTTLDLAENLYVQVFAGADAQPIDIAIAPKLYVDCTAGADAVNDLTITPAIKLGGNGSAGATTTMQGYFTYVTFDADVACGSTAISSVTTRQSVFANAFATATGIGTVWVNLYDFEPTFRTALIDPETWTYLVPPDVWTLIITDDNPAMQTFTKQPDEVLGYDMDFTAWFAQIPDDYIVSATCVVASAVPADSSLVVTQTLLMGAVVDQPPTGGFSQIVKVWLSGGLDGTTYQLTVSIVTNDGRHKEVDFKMKVKEI